MTIRIATLAAVAIAVSIAVADEKPVVDRGKYEIEAPAKSVLVQTQQQAAPKQLRTDITKRLMEFPAKAVVKKTAPPKPPVDISKKRVERLPESLVAGPKPLIVTPAPRPKLDVGKAVIEMPPHALLVEQRGMPEPRPRPAAGLDLTKDVIEVPPKQVLVDALPVARPRLDDSKADIESPPLEFLAEKSTNPPKEVNDANDRGFDKVAPGKVKWHKDFKTAVEKSKASGKPVLLFQLLGQLDEEFT